MPRFAYRFSSRLCAFSILSVAILSGCGGGGGSDAAQSSETDNVVSALTVDSQVKASVKDLSTAWNANVSVVDDTHVSFAGNPGLVNGDVFVVNDKAYKVAGVAGGSGGSTLVTVSRPELKDIYSKLEFSGQMDAMEFIPNPALVGDAAAVVTAGAPVAAVRAPAVEKVDFLMTRNKEGFHTGKLSITKKFDPYPLEGEGSLEIGARGDFRQIYDALNNSGSAIVDIYLKPSMVLKIKKKIATDPDYREGVCSSDADTRKRGRIWLGSIPLGKALAAVPGGASISAVTNLAIPVCLIANVKTDMNMNILELSGTYQGKIYLGSGQSPQVSHQNTLSVSVPPSSATLTEATTAANKSYSVAITGEAGMEAGIELADKLSIVSVGVSVAAVTKHTLTGTFGGELLSKPLASLLTEPRACLEYKAEAMLQTSSFAEFAWSKKPLIATAAFPVITPVTKKWGLCKQVNFTKIDGSGKALPDGAATWSCVLDNRNGMLWEVKDSRGGLRAREDRYTWYIPAAHDGYDGQPDTGRTCSSSLSQCNTTAYVQAVNQQGLCGKKDWRMPSREEMLTLYDESKYSQTDGLMIDRAYFPDTQPSWYYTSSSAASVWGNDFVWVVGYHVLWENYGNSSYREKRLSYYNDGGYVRLVRPDTSL